LRLEADDELAADVEHRPLDHRRLRHHQGDRLLLGQVALVLVGQRAKGRSGAIEEGLPSDVARPGFEPAALDAGGLVVVKRIGDAALVEPGARLLHGVAVLDAVDRDGFRHSLSLEHALSRIPGTIFRYAAQSSAPRPRNTSVSCTLMGRLSISPV